MWKKADNLKTLKEKGFLVPDFIELGTNDNFEEKLKKLDQTKKYAVRSNMLIEDSESSSFAGQFKTHLNLNYSEIIPSIKDVISNAKDKRLQEKQISVIIQEYITLDYSAVAFSRNPNWSSEMLIEYHKWIWEEIVSWKITPKKIWIYHFEKNFIDKFWDLKEAIWEDSINNIVENIKEIEKIFSFPQDIEWGIKWTQIYFLQSRNITSITESDFKNIKFIEKFIEKEPQQNFLYEKNEISEIIPKVWIFSFSLLKKIYWPNWPISKFYESNWLKITHEKIFKIIGHELFIDKEAEINNIFPSITYFKQKYTTKFVFWREFLKQSETYLK